MSVPLGIYKFEVYDGSTFITKLTYYAPLRRSASGESYYIDGNTGDGAYGVMNVFGGSVSMLFRNKTYPVSPYLHQTVFEVCKFPEFIGFNMSPYTDGRVLTFYLDKANHMGIYICINTGSPTYYQYKYFRGNWESGWFNDQGWVQDYWNQWGMYLGVGTSHSIPLPDWSQLAVVGDTSTDIFCYGAYDCLSDNRYNSTSGEAHSYPYRVNIRATGSSGPSGMTKAQMLTWLGAYTPSVPDPDNPFWPGGPSEPGDNDPGNFSEDSDVVTPDTMPILSSIATGMATLFTPDSTQLKSLSDIFWGSQWWTALQNTVEGIDKMFVSLGIVPFAVDAGSTVEVTWLGLAWTEVYLTLAAKQYYEFDMGTINMGNDDRIFTSGSALDYSPFSKLGIYLPFIGYQELDIDEFRGASVNLKYRIDILSGTCVALISVGGNTIYQFTGNCMTQIPITSQSFESMITNAVNVGIAVSGVRSASAVGSAAGEVSQEMVDKGKASEKQRALSDTKSRVHVEGAVDRLLSACANSIMGLKPNYDKSGAVSNSASLLAVKQPFLFLTTPRQCIPEHYQRYSGFPSNITRKIGECSGFLVVESIRLNGLVATSSEVEEIYELLKSGVIV